MPVAVRTTLDRVEIGGVDVTASVADVGLTVMPTVCDYRDPGPTITITQDLSRPTRVEIQENVEFPGQEFTSAVAVTRRQLDDSVLPNVARQAAHEEARRQLVQHVAGHVQTLMDSMQSVGQASRYAAQAMRDFGQRLTQTSIVSTGQWEQNAEEMAELYRLHATVDSQSWRTAAREFNQAQQAITDWLQVSYTASTATTGTTYYPNQFGTGDTYVFVNNQNATMYPVMPYGTLYQQGTYGMPLVSYFNGDTWDRTIQLDSTIQAEVCACGTCANCLAQAQRRLERQRQDELARRRAVKRARERVVAEKRGRALLLSLLDEHQMNEYAKTGCFRVLAADGRAFRLRKGKTAELLAPDGVADASYCIHLYGGHDVDGEYREFVPEDTLISQMLLLRSDPAEFERIANITKLQRRTTPTAAERAQAQRWLEDHDRECEATLRAEGIENPREWVRQLQERTARNYREGRLLERPRGGVIGAIEEAAIEEGIFAVDALGDASVAVA